MDNHWPFTAAPKTATLVSKHIFASEPVCFAFHEWEKDEWQFFPDRVTKQSDAMVVCLSEILELDKSIREIADLPAGWSTSRANQTETWTRKLNHPYPVFGSNGFYLDNAETYEQLYPESYKLPAREIRENLKTGDGVKLIFRFAGELSPRQDMECERMWVEITEADKEEFRYRGILLNEPATHSEISKGYELWFHACHILAISGE